MIGLNKKDQTAWRTLSNLREEAAQLRRQLKELAPEVCEALAAVEKAQAVPRDELLERIGQHKYATLPDGTQLTKQRVVSKYYRLTGKEPS